MVEVVSNLVFFPFFANVLKVTQDDTALKITIVLLVLATTVQLVLTTSIRSPAVVLPTTLEVHVTRR